MRFLTATLGEALGNLRIAPLRTVLALLGIAIGCAAVVAILQIGFIAERQILEQLEKAGLNLITAEPSFEMESVQEEPTQPPSSLEVEAKLLRLPDVRRAALVKEHGQEVHIRGESVYLQILGVTPAFIGINGITLEAGSFDALDLDVAPIGIIGSEVTAGLDSPAPLEVGDHVRLGFDGYKISGLMSPADYNSMTGLDVGRALLIPEKSLERLTQQISSWRVVVEAVPEADKAAIQAGIEDLFQKDYAIDVDVQSAETIIAAEQEQQRSLTLLLTALGGVSLIVGTVGVANVMLASVAERRKEIGLRMALGAGPRAIKILFLSEAIMLCCLGGLLGTMIGIISSNFYASLSVTAFTLSQEVLAAALIISTLTGLIAGYYPARQSARLDPVEALQSE